jgi:hypothetical protein
MNWRICATSGKAVKPIILFDNVFLWVVCPNIITKVRDATETYSAWRGAPLRFARARVQQIIMEDICMHDTSGIY